MSGAQPLVSEAARALRERLGTRIPTTGLVLGSGLGELLDEIEHPIAVPFAEIPGFPPPSVEGHAGRMVAGSLAGREVVALSGRFHVYEGHPAEVVALPTRVMHALGVRTMLLSNAAGGLRPTFRPGDLMLITDHINLTWRNPLIGPTAAGEERFPDMSAPYDPDLLALARTAALDAGVPLVEGTYLALAGPAYETPAEVRAYRLLGADAVGMSTVPEVIVARALGMRVVGVSCITNVHTGVPGPPLTHEEVLDVAARARARFARLVGAFLARLAR
ncbi:MAG TPA: purine-nucleoside phosphorylase [Gemmatimonadaceae bacterium]|nr:purine-nucleoside phosphorylase [Gemmatimonadaceae bacterium]